MHIVGEVDEKIVVENGGLLRVVVGVPGEQNVRCMAEAMIRVRAADMALAQHGSDNAHDNGGGPPTHGGDEDDGGGDEDGPTSDGGPAGDNDSGDNGHGRRTEQEER